MAYRVDLSLSSEEILRGLINFDNKTDFTEKQLSFNPIGAVPLTLDEYYEKRRNSKVSVRYKGKMIGEKTYYYNRIDFPTLLGNLGIAVPWGVYQHTHELLPYVRQQLGINLSEDDIISAFIDPEAAIGEITIFRRNITYIGSITVVFKGHPDTLEGQVLNKTLSGFTIDNIEPAEIT